MLILTKAKFSFSLLCAGLLVFFLNSNQLIDEPSPVPRICEVKTAIPDEQSDEIVVVKKPTFKTHHLDPTTTTTKPKLKADVVLLILTIPNSYIRESQRKTWLSVKPHNLTFRHFYCMGNHTEALRKDPKLNAAIEEEQQKYGDLVFLDMVDSYENLTTKVRHCMQYAYDNFEFAYLLKTDDDSFIRTFVLEQRIEHFYEHYPQKLYAGAFIVGGEVLKGTHKNADNEFGDSKTYLPYCSGAGYILSHDLVKLLLQPAVPFRVLKNEDTEIGFLLAPYQIIRLNEIYRVVPISYPHLCSQPGVWYLSHYMRPDAMAACYSRFMKEDEDNRAIHFLPDHFV